jgi:hypothetical protein
MYTGTAALGNESIAAAMKTGKEIPTVENMTVATAARVLSGMQVK